MKRVFLSMFVALLIAVPTNAATIIVIGNESYYMVSEEDHTMEIEGVHSASDYYSGEVVLPTTVEYKGETYTIVGLNGAYYDNAEVTKVTIPTCYTHIEKNSFRNCASLKTVVFEEGSQLNLIGENAFYKSPVFTEITIPAGVTELAYNAFSNCAELETVTFAEGSQLSTLGTYAFMDSPKLKSIDLPKTLTTMGDYVFSGCTGLEIVTFAEGCELATLGTYAFKDCTSLTSVSFGANSKLSSIGRNAFYECTSLAELTLPEGLSEISKWAFYECKLLSAINLPSTLTTIGDNVFYDCTALASLTSLNPEPPTCTSDYTFRNIPTTCILRVPEGSVDAYAADTYWQVFTNVEEIQTLAEGEKFESDGLFYTVLSTEEKTVEVTWGGSTNTSGTESYIGDITIPKTTSYEGTTYNVIGIGEYAFNHSTVTTLHTGDGVTYIGDYGVSSCQSLTTLDLSANVDSIASWAFSYDYYLTDVSLPDSLSYLGDRAFYYCDRMEHISVPDKIKTVMGLTFYYCVALTDITLPAALDSIGTNAFGVCSALEEITLPSTVRVIGNLAFNQCSKLSKVYCYAETPPTCTTGSSVTFNLVDTENATLYVPVGTAEAYATAGGWQDFGTIIEMTPAEVETLDATDITTTSAILHGTVVAGYDGTMEKKGFEYWKEGSEDDVHSVTVLTDDVMARISSLEPETTYFFHVYATDSSGTMYGEDKSFTTLEDTSGISSVSADVENATIYNLQGIRVTDMSQKGIYIVNGRKVLVK